MNRPFPISNGRKSYSKPAEGLPVGDAVLNDESLKTDSVAYLNWDESISVDGDIVDADHKSFFEISKVMIESKLSGHHELILENCLSMLEDYVTGHFNREELAMRAANYPRLYDHKNKHDQFRNRIRRMTSEYRRGDKSAVDDLPALVVSWFRSHIVTDDVPYKGWVQSTHWDKRPLYFLMPHEMSATNDDDGVEWF